MPGGSKRELTVTSAYLSYNNPIKTGYWKSLTTAEGIHLSSSPDIMPMHTTLYRGAQTSIHKENA
jgi:hypothetical protein